MSFLPLLGPLFPESQRLTPVFGWLEEKIWVFHCFQMFIFDFFQLLWTSLRSGAQPSPSTPTSSPQNFQDLFQLEVSDHKHKFINKSRNQLQDLSFPHPILWYFKLKGFFVVDLGWVPALWGGGRGWIPTLRVPAVVTWLEKLGAPVFPG